MSAFDDEHSGAVFRQAEDPYAGKSFAEVLRARRAKLDADLAKSAPAPKAPEAQAAATEAQPVAQPVATGADETLEARKARLQA